VLVFFFAKGGVLVINNEPCGVCKHGRARGRLGHAEQGAELLACATAAPQETVEMREGVVSS
jgi:hypothetical protein